MTTRQYDRALFSERLNSLMRETGLNQQQLADALKCSRKTINQYCTGKTVPDDHMKRELEKFFRADILSILGVNDYKNDFAELDAKIPEEEHRRLRFRVELLQHVEKRLKAMKGGKTND